MSHALTFLEAVVRTSARCWGHKNLAEGVALNKWKPLANKRIIVSGRTFCSVPSSSKSNSSMSIHHDARKKKFQTEDGEAYIQYALSESTGGKSTIDLYHTYVPPSKRGGGVAGALAKAAFEHAKEKGFLVIPSCTYISGAFLARHPEWQEQVAPSTKL
eukprot:TRINITY_DN10767_c0_g1_i1.p1 TRINITY_DN10767_c0_g1~~TRINITY_DN10767_c0_g1_i1.p1  ORF type:complete len:159 (+),score=22.70 TRINITY_DN10767_c0_g1_i1:84-560(+)